MSFWSKLKIFWNGVAEFMYKYIGGLIMEEKGVDGLRVVSIGRTTFLTTFLIMAYVWLFKAAPEGKDVAPLPANILEVFYALGAYVFGSKLTGVAGSIWGKK